MERLHNLEGFGLWPIFVAWAPAPRIKHSVQHTERSTNAAAYLLHGSNHLHLAGGQVVHRSDHARWGGKNEDPRILTGYLRDRNEANLQVRGNLDQRQGKQIKNR